MLTRPLSRSARAVVLGVAAVSSVAFALPASAAGAGTDISIRGGNALAEVVCGNVAAAGALAAQRGFLLQRNNCSATAPGGAATLENVKITINRAAMRASEDARRLAAAALDTSATVAFGTCRHLPGTASNQRNICSARAQGGRVILDTVTFVVHHADGTQTVTRRPTVVLPSQTGTATADCVNVDSQVFDQRDDCRTLGIGGSLALRNVDVVDQSGTTHRDVNVTVKGGDGTANTFCFNVEDTAGHILQINVCRSQGTGGDVHLRNVQIDTVTG